MEGFQQLVSFLPSFTESSMDTGLSSSVGSVFVLVLYGIPWHVATLVILAILLLRIQDYNFMQAAHTTRARKNEKQKYP